MTKYFIIVFLFLISFDLFSTNRDIQKDLTEKFSLYLKILKNRYYTKKQVKIT